MMLITGRDILERCASTAVRNVAGVLVLAAFALLAWLFLAATPNQSSAECEALRAEMEAEGK